MSVVASTVSCDGRSVRVAATTMLSSSSTMRTVGGSSASSGCNTAASTFDDPGDALELGAERAHAGEPLRRRLRAAADDQALELLGDGLERRQQCRQRLVNVLLAQRPH